MDDFRRGQIALLYLKHKIRSEGVIVKPEMTRQIENTAKAIGIPVKECREFAQLLVTEMLDEIFAKSFKPN